MGQVDQDTSSDALSMQLLGLHFVKHSLPENFELTLERWLEVFVGDLGQVLKLLLIGHGPVERLAVTLTEKTFEEASRSVFDLGALGHASLLLQSKFQVFFR